MAMRALVWSNGKNRQDSYFGLFSICVGFGGFFKIPLLNLEKAPFCLVTLARANRYSCLNNTSVSNPGCCRGHLGFRGGSQ